MSENDFSWNDNESVVVPRVDAIAVYANPDGDVVIRQQDPMGNDDAIIVVPLKMVPELVAAIQREVSSQK